MSSLPSSFSLCQACLPMYLRVPVARTGPMVEVKEARLHDVPRHGGTPVGIAPLVVVVLAVKAGPMCGGSR